MKLPIKLNSTYLGGIVSCLNSGKFAYLTSSNGVLNIYGFIPYKVEQTIYESDFTREIVERIEKALSYGDDVQVKVEQKHIITIIKLDRKLLGKVIKV